MKDLRTASHKNDTNSVVGLLSMLTDKGFANAIAVMWRAKQIERVCHSSKDAETLAISKIVDEVAYAGRQIETVMFWRL